MAFDPSWASLAEEWVDFTEGLGRKCRLDPWHPTIIHDITIICVYVYMYIYITLYVYMCIHNIYNGNIHHW